MNWNRTETKFELIIRSIMSEMTMDKSYMTSETDMESEYCLNNQTTNMF